MKQITFVITMLFSSLFFCSFQVTDIETQKILQKCLETSGVQNLFEKDIDGNYLPLYLVTNDHFTENIDVHFANEKVQVFSKKGALDFNPESEIIEITKFKLKENKAIIEFKYQEKKAKIKLVKDNNHWEYRSINIKGGGTFNIDVNF